MKRIDRNILYLLATVLLSACTSTDTELMMDESVIKKPNVIIAEIQEPVVYQQGITRSTLIYNYSEDRMKFSWGGGDVKLGVYPVGNDPKKSQPIPYRLESILSDLGGVFESEDKKVSLAKTKKYISLKPYFKKDDYSQIQLSYEGQTAEYSPQFCYYPKFSKNIGYLKDYPEKVEEYNIKYNESEARACQHLGEFDYLISAQTESATGDFYFKLRRVGVIARFYFKFGEEQYKDLVIESIRLAADKGNKPFNTQISLNASSAIDGENVSVKAIRNLKTSGFVELKYPKGLDLTQTDKDADDYYIYNNSCYIAAYMMLAPVDLSSLPSDALLRIYVNRS
ncbi:MAG: hypothetical protein Q4E26_03525 [Prevotellaceae bacterium]|nr:hypothetical protein [Prevotellaceae bacterium]